MASRNSTCSFTDLPAAFVSKTPNPIRRKRKKIPVSDDFQPQQITEKTPKTPVPFPVKTDRQRDIEEIISLLEKTKDTGVAMVLKAAREAYSERPMRKNGVVISMIEWRNRIVQAGL